MKMKERSKKGNRKLWIVWLMMVCIGTIGCQGKSGQGENGVVPTKNPTATNTAAVTETPGDTEQVFPTEKPSEEELLEQRLQKQIDDMTLEEKVGQMFLVRCPENAGEAVEQYKVGGFVLFAGDFENETKTSMKEKLASYQAAAEIPLILSVDEEGGAVVRVSKYPAFRTSAFLSPRELYQEGGMKRIAEDTKEKAELLRSLGIHVNLAPVCDISTEKSAFMYERSFGGTAEETAEYVKTVVEAAKEAGLGSVLKHFPGYGENGDTHEGIVYDVREYKTYLDSDFKPFLAGIEAGAGAIMVSHNVVRCMDAERPASLSQEVHRILREELAFDGVILTDDLYMDAIQDFTGTETAAVAAVLAGNDMLCCTDFEVQIPAVIKAVREGRISEEQINASVFRVLKWKTELGLLTAEEN